MVKDREINLIYEELDERLLGGFTISDKKETYNIDSSLKENINDRKYDIGKLLDPLADKLTQTAISLSFIFLIKKYAIFFWIILIKDGLMMIGSYYSYRKNIKISSAKWFGKVATFTFYITMILIILMPQMPDIIKTTLLTLVVILSVFSMVMYFPIFFKNLREVEIR